MSKITNGSMKLIKSEITDIIYSTIGTDLPNNFDKIDAGVDAVNTRVNNIITTPVDGVSAQEIIDARGGNPTLGNRLDNMQSQTDILQDEVDNLVNVGIPKLVSFDYDIQATVDGQTKFLIPYEYLSLTTDTVEVFVNGIAVPDTYYVITEPVEVESVITLGYVTLTESKPVGTIVKVRILKNVPNGDEGSVDGKIITVDSIPLNRINNDELNSFMDNSLIDINTQLNEKAKQTDLAKLQGYAEYNISASTTIADNTTVYLTLDTVVKAGSLTELASGGIKIKESGMYEINAMTNFNTSSAGHRKIGIYKNDVLVKLIAFAPNNNVTVAQIIANLDCVLNDIIKIGVYQNSGASLTNITNSPYSGVQVRRIG